MQEYVGGGSKYPKQKVPFGKLADIYGSPSIPVQKNVPKTSPRQTTTVSKTSAPASVSLSGGGYGGGYSGGYGGGGYGGGGYGTASLGGGANLQGLWAEANGYKTQLDALVKQGFKYDPNTDPNYKSLQETAQKQAKVASKGAMETMNDRGILNSTVTSDRIAQIEQSAQDEVTKAVPALENAAFAKYNNQIQNLYNLWNTVYNQAKDERGFNEDTRRWNANFGFEQEKFRFTKDQAAIQNALAERGMSLDEAQHELSRLKADQDTIGMMNEAATQAALSELLGFEDAGSAMNYLMDNTSRYQKSRVNFTELLSSLNKRWPGFDEPVGAGGEQPFSE